MSVDGARRHPATASAALATPAVITSGEAALQTPAEVRALAAYASRATLPRAPQQCSACGSPVHTRKFHGAGGAALPRLCSRCRKAQTRAADQGLCRSCHAENMKAHRAKAKAELMRLRALAGGTA